MECDGVRDGNPSSGSSAVSSGTAGFICGGGFKYPAALYRFCLCVCAHTGDPGCENAGGSSCVKDNLLTKKKQNDKKIVILPNKKADCIKTDTWGLLRKKRRYTACNLGKL